MMNVLRANSLSVCRGQLSLHALSISRPATRCSGGMRCVLRSSQTAMVGYSACLQASWRRYTNALWRLPPENTIPTHSSAGEEVDVELFVNQFKGLFRVLRMSKLVDMVHEMRSYPYYECLFSSDILFQHYDLILPMPKFGRENRSAEVSETLRYIRGSGATGDIVHALQDVKGGSASGGDFVSTTHGILMGYGTARTNKLCMLAMNGSDGENKSAATKSTHALSVEPIEMLPDSPPLADILAFSGTRTLLISDSVHGRRAAEQVTQRIPTVNWQVIKMEPGCFFLSHLCGAESVFDVLCDQDFPTSMERIGECGLNPFPVEWSEPRKLGISMRSVCLIARFARGGMSGGGYGQSSSHVSSGYNYNSRHMSSNSRLFSGGYRRYGDTGTGLMSQLENEEFGTPVYQSPPRYAPPMHRRGSIVPRDE